MTSRGPPPLRHVRVVGQAPSAVAEPVVAKLRRIGDVALSWRRPDRTGALPAGADRGCRARTFFATLMNVDGATGYAEDLRDTARAIDWRIFASVSVPSPSCIGLSGESVGY
jgi:hypothetical protein